MYFLGQQTIYKLLSRGHNATKKATILPAGQPWDKPVACCIWPPPLSCSRGWGDAAPGDQTVVESTSVQRPLELSLRGLVHTIKEGGEGRRVDL